MEKISDWKEGLVRAKTEGQILCGALAIADTVGRASEVQRS